MWWVPSDTKEHPSEKNTPSERERINDVNDDDEEEDKEEEEEELCIFFWIARVPLRFLEKREERKKNDSDDAPVHLLISISISIRVSRVCEWYYCDGANAAFSLSRFIS